MANGSTGSNCCPVGPEIRVAMQRSTSAIRELNDELRQHLLGGDTVISDKIAALGPKALTRLTECLAKFDQFCPFTDPKHKHAFGALPFDGSLVVFRIDYSNLTRKPTRSGRSRLDAARHDNHVGR